MNELFPISSQRSLPEKAVLIESILSRHYGAPFHFFSTKDALSEMVSAILSHRTKNAVTRDAYHKLRNKLPTWEEVRDAPTQVVEEAIRIVTFAEVKSPRIQHALQYITDFNNGELHLDFLTEMQVNQARSWLEQIPGIGVKTSAAILNFSHLRLPALVVDMHHLRIAQRLGLVPERSTLDKGARLLESYLAPDANGQKVYDNHQVFMRHGQRICHWKHPDCKNCVVQEFCDYYQKG